MVTPAAKWVWAIMQKERHEFGRPVNHFTLSDVIVLDEFLPDKSEAAPQHIERNPSVLDVQAISTLTETYVRAHASLAHHPAKIARVALARRFGRMHDGAPTGGRNPSGR